MRFNWSSRNKYRSTWHAEILTSVQNHLFGVQNENIDMIKLHGFTEIHVKEEIKDTDYTYLNIVVHQYRAHPSYCSGPSWHIWENLEWKWSDTDI